MISFPLPLKVAQKGKNHAVFEVQNLYPGYGVTVGNALRRVLLSSLGGAAVTEVKIKGAPHEFSTIPGVLEDAMMVILNLKNLRFAVHGEEPQKVQLKVKGEKEVKGKDFELPSQVELANPELHIATITDAKAELEMELTVERGLGYVPKDQRHVKKAEIGAMYLDAIYTPVKNVSFHVENMRVGERTDFDKLNLEIETDGTIAPEEAFAAACDILIKHFAIIAGKEAAGEEAEGIKTEAGADEPSQAQDQSKLAVEELGLSTRTVNLLAEHSIKTVAGLVKKSEKGLLELEGMGEKAVSEIKKKLKKNGLELKSE